MGKAPSFVRKFDANTYLYTSRALTYLTARGRTGNGSARCAHWGRRRARTLLIHLQLRLAIPAGRGGGIEAGLRALGKPVDCGT